jgi:hypothetical protein
MSQIFLLPSENFASSAHLYSSGSNLITIRAFLRAKTRDIQIKLNRAIPFDLQVETPPLYWETYIWDNGARSRFVLNHYKINLDNSITVKPYQLGNVDQHGTVCFGNRSPRNLKEANNLFWSMPFSGDYWSRWKYHKSNMCNGRKHACDNFIKELCPRKHFCPKALEGASCGTNTCFCCQKNCRCHRVNPYTEEPCACCIFNCSCRCACNILEEFKSYIIEHHQNLQDPRIPSISLPHHSFQYFCPTQADGIYISLNRTSRPGDIADKHQDPIVLGFAKSEDLETWNIKIGSENYGLSKNQVSFFHI